MELEEYEGKRFGLVLTDENDDSVLYSGWIASRVGGTLRLVRPGGEITLEVGWLNRIRPIDTDTAREIVPDADFWLPLSVGPNPEDKETDLPTGMKWPE